MGARASWRLRTNGRRLERRSSTHERRDQLRGGALHVDVAKESDASRAQPVHRDAHVVVLSHHPSEHRVRLIAPSDRTPSHVRHVRLGARVGHGAKHALVWWHLAHRACLGAEAQGGECGAERSSDVTRRWSPIGTHWLDESAFASGESDGASGLHECTQCRAHQSLKERSGAPSPLEEGQVDAHDGVIASAADRSEAMCDGLKLAVIEIDPRHLEVLPRRLGA
eukprot:7385628-Prymnesium_polylepis.3